MLVDLKPKSLRKYSEISFLLQLYCTFAQRQKLVVTALGGQVLKAFHALTLSEEICL